MPSNITMIAFTQLPFSQSKPCQACRCGSLTHQSTGHKDCPLKRAVPREGEYATILQPNLLTDDIKRLFANDQIVYQNEGELLMLGDMLIKKTKDELEPTKKLVDMLCWSSYLFGFNVTNAQRLIAAMTDESYERMNQEISDRLLHTERRIPLRSYRANNDTLKYHAKPLIDTLNDSYIKANKLLERFKPFFTRKVAEHIQREMRMAQYAYIPANLRT